MEESGNLSKACQDEDVKKVVIKLSPHDLFSIAADFIERYGNSEAHHKTENSKIRAMTTEFRADDGTIITLQWDVKSEGYFRSIIHEHVLWKDREYILSLIKS